MCGTDLVALALTPVIIISSIILVPRLMKKSKSKEIEVIEN